MVEMSPLSTEIEATVAACASYPSKRATYAGLLEFRPVVLNLVEDFEDTEVDEIVAPELSARHKSRVR